jgi:uncharacterized protein
MTSRKPDPRRLDVASVAADALRLEGRWPLAGFERLHDGPAQDGDVQWSVRGEQRAVAGAPAEIWLHLTLRARLWRDCQRCLQPVAIDLDLARALRFVADEAAAEALDAETEDDVLALPRYLDLHELAEDELLLALPLVPMHEQCPQSLPTSVGFEAGDGAGEPAANPFAALAGLRGGHKA